MVSSEIELQLTLAEAESDAERLDELTRRLMRDLEDLGVESVERPPGDVAPEAAKGDPFTWGALTLALVPALLPKLVEFLRDWARRNEGRTVKIKTPIGLEVEFTPGEKFTETDLLALVEKLTQAGRV